VLQAGLLFTFARDAFDQLVTAAPSRIAPVPPTRTRNMWLELLISLPEYSLKHKMRKTFGQSQAGCFKSL